MSNTLIKLHARTRLSSSSDGIRLSVYLIVLALPVALGIAGCSDHKPPAALASVRESPHQLSGQERREDATASHDAESAGDDALTVKLTAAGIPTKYVAHFDRNKLTRIDETRQADQRQGIYEYQGARLLKYSGAAVDSTATLNLEFDLHGTLTSAQSTNGSPAEAQVIAIRERAQLLRSHALAQQATRTH